MRTRQNSKRQMEYTKYLEQFNRFQRINRREDRFTPLNHSYMQPTIQEQERRMKMQQRQLEQDIGNYNLMMAEQQHKSRQTRFRSVDTPEIRLPHLGQEYLRSKSRQTNQLLDYSFVSENNQRSNYRQFLKQESPIREQIIELKQEMTQNKKRIQSQIDELIDFIKFNESQANQYLKLQLKLQNMIDSTNVEPLYRMLQAELKQKAEQQQHLYQDHEKWNHKNINIPLITNTKYINKNENLRYTNLQSDDQLDAQDLNI